MLKKICIGLMITNLIVGAFATIGVILPILDSITRIETAANFTTWVMPVIRQIKSPFAIMVICTAIEESIKFVMDKLTD